MKTNDDAERLIAATVNGVRHGPVSRREAVQWVMAAVAAAALPTRGSAAPVAEVGRNNVPQEKAAKAPNPDGTGYGTDPNLMKTYAPGDLWPLTLTPEQRKTTAALVDVILPNDAFGPAASALGVVGMIDEWISAPYPQQQSDRSPILEGLAWIESESNHRFQKSFADLSAEQHKLICDDICFEPEAKPEFRKAAGFFGRIRRLSAAAYYATPEGWKAIGYVGNVALPSFEGPPAEVLEKLGVTQTVR